MKIGIIETPFKGMPVGSNLCLLGCMVQNLHPYNNRAKRCTTCNYRDKQ